MTVTINEKVLEVYFGCTAVEVFYQQAGVPKPGSVFNVGLLSKIVWAGIVNGAELQDKEPEVVYSDVYKWVDAQVFDPEGQTLLTSLSDAFSNSQAIKDAAKVAQPEEVEPVKKKASTLKKSAPLHTVH